MVMMGGFGTARSAANPGGGLPFAGVPSEMQAGVDRLLRDEPDHGEPDVSFTYRAGDETPRRLTLRSMIFRHWQLGLLALLFIGIVSVANQAGPALISSWDGQPNEYGAALRQHFAELRSGRPAGDA